MCRLTELNETSPSLARFGSKRSSFSSSSRSSSASSIRKRVSFDDTVDIYSIERVKKEQTADLFYRPEDYRRFRSDTCLELLDQRVAPHTALIVLFQKLMASVRKNKQQKQAADYPWLTPYHPHEEPSQPELSSGSRIIGEASPERRLIEELAFL